MRSSNDKLFPAKSSGATALCNCSRLLLRMMDEDARIARALNHLGENTDLFAADRDNLLDFIKDYFDSHVTEVGKIRPNLPIFSSHPDHS